MSILDINFLLLSNNSSILWDTNAQALRDSRRCLVRFLSVILNCSSLVRAARTCWPDVHMRPCSNSYVLPNVIAVDEKSLIQPSYIYFHHLVPSVTKSAWYWTGAMFTNVDLFEHVIYYDLVATKAIQRQISFSNEPALSKIAASPLNQGSWAHEIAHCMLGTLYHIYGDI